MYPTDCLPTFDDMIREISIPDSLYEQASNLAQEMQISPSDLFSLALEEYLGGVPRSGRFLSYGHQMLIGLCFQLLAEKL
jgi:hypothetical protein